MKIYSQEKIENPNLELVNEIRDTKLNTNKIVQKVWHTQQKQK